MLRGLYESALGMASRLTLQDITANNLANVNSTGFQRELAAVHSRRLPLAKGGEDKRDPITAPRSLDAYAVRDTRPGQQVATGEPGDIALDGAGYFVVNTANGPQMLRSGSFRPGQGGALALATGEMIQGVDGQPIRVDGPGWHIAPTGLVTSANGRTLGQIRIVLPQSEVRGAGSSMATASFTEAPEGSVAVRAGYLEHSNVNTMHEMVDMIAGYRAYEADQRAIQSQDETLQQLFQILR